MSGSGDDHGCDDHVRCEARLRRIEQAVTQIHDKLFVGNGRNPLLTQVENNTQAIRLLLWVAGVCSVAAVGGIFGLIFSRG